jgi:hypothetical protein
MTKLEEKVSVTIEDQQFIVALSMRVRPVLREDGGRLWVPQYGEAAYRWIIDQRMVASLIESAGIPCVLQPSEIQAAVHRLVAAYVRDELHIGTEKVASTANMEHATSLAVLFKRMVQKLDDPRTSQICKETVALRNLCKQWAARFACTAVELRSELRGSKCRSRNLEGFIRGSLAECYERLFNCRARCSRNPTEDPFLRFGAMFFALLGRPIADTTLARYIRPRTSLKVAGKRRLHRFPTG